LGQPSDTKLILGAGAGSAAGAGRVMGSADMEVGANRDRWRYQGITRVPPAFLLVFGKEAKACGFFC
jgi:hypothetical protein